MFRTDFEEFIIHNVDILIGNENEFKELNKSSTNKFDLDNIDKIVEVGVVTMGEKGAIILNDQQKIAIEAEKVDKVIDSTGAGDMFAAGFLFELLNGKSLEISGKFGCKVASKIVTQYGARPPKDFLDNIK
jgi:sugar/nucleoside kinase (ribokinase family)